MASGAPTSTPTTARKRSTKQASTTSKLSKSNKPTKSVKAAKPVKQVKKTKLKPHGETMKVDGRALRELACVQRLLQRGQRKGYLSLKDIKQGLAATKLHADEVDAM